MRDLSLHILDIVQNSINAGASEVTVHMGHNVENNSLVLEIIDDGMGMDADFLNRVDDPFVTTRTSRKVGLGISLLKESALKSGGNFKITSEKNKGTKVNAIFPIHNIDRLPLGNVSDTLIALLKANPDVRFVVLMDSKNGEFRLDTAEILEILKGVSITEFEVLNWLKEYVDDGIKNIFGGVLNEVDS